MRRLLCTLPLLLLALLLVGCDECHHFAMNTSQHAPDWSSEGYTLNSCADCGYEYNQNTAAILDILKEKDVKAVFFITGNYAKIKYTYKDGKETKSGG